MDDLYLDNTYGLTYEFKQNDVAIDITSSTFEIILETKKGCIKSEFTIARNGSSPWQTQTITYTNFDGTTQATTRDLEDDPQNGKTLLDFIPSQYLTMENGKGDFFLSITSVGKKKTILKDSIVIKEVPCG